MYRWLYCDRYIDFSVNLWYSAMSRILYTLKAKFKGTARAAMFATRLVPYLWDFGAGDDLDCMDGMDVIIDDSENKMNWRANVWGHIILPAPEIEFQ